MVGTQVRHYQVQSLIGDGGMGAVYLAKDLNLGRPVALKVLLPELLRVPDLRQRLAQEARVQGRLNHPGIVSVYEFDSESGLIVMEYVDGRPLDDVIVDVGGPLPLPFVKRTLRQIAQALDYAHSYRDDELKQGIVHRDIKPANILIRQSGDESIAKVTDFGVARIIGDARRLTATGSQMGTLWYMSPEQVKSPKEVDHRSDIYALGVVLYEMLTGAVPFDGDSDFNIMSSIVQEPPPLLIAHNVDLPGEVEAILQRALNKDPEARFQSCMALCTAFEDALTPKVAASSPPGVSPAPALAQGSPAQGGSPMSKEDKTLIGIAAVVVILLISLGVIWANTTGAKETVSRPSSPEAVVRAWVKANGERDTETMMSYYADTIQWYNKRLKNYDLFASKARYHQKFNLVSEESIDNITVAYNSDRSMALVEYDSEWYWEGEDTHAFWFDARRRVRLKRSGNSWLIDCEEEALVRRASNPDAEGTEICSLYY